MSITLTNPVTVTVGGNTVETDLSAAMTSFYVDFVNNVVGFTVLNGTVSGSNFTPGIEVPGEIQLTMNLVTGNWTTSSGLSGNVAPAVLAPQIAQFTTSRNGAESFFVYIGAVTGTYTAWS